MFYSSIEMLIRVNRSSEAPLSAQIADQVKDAIAAGALVSGDQLPPARELAQSLGVNIHTVLKGFAELRAAGLVDLRRGRAARIACNVELAKARLADQLSFIVRDADAAGIPRTEIVRLIEEYEL